MQISPNVVILTRSELEAIKNASFQRGVARGRFEERWDMNHPDNPPERAVEKQDPASPDAGGGPIPSTSTPNR